RLGPRADAAAVVHATITALDAAAAPPSGAAARYTPARIDQLLRTHTPGTESQLAGWAQDLQALEKEVIHR
ncbi:hypothetical protein ACFQ36_09995, partial [Arthrobacter sp. GCM10027362]